MKIYILYENEVFLGHFFDLEKAEKTRDERAAHSEKHNKGWVHRIATFYDMNYVHGLVQRMQDAAKDGLRAIEQVTEERLELIDHETNLVWNELGEVMPE